MSNIPTKTFQEVHEELDNESFFLNKEHDIESFAKKAKFLTEIGFTNSIATKVYGAIAENHGVIQEYERKYNGVYKFILKPQLSRVCEKYNLYVRDPKFFLGDIPKSNIQDIVNFKVDIHDLNIPKDYIITILDQRLTLARTRTIVKPSTMFSLEELSRLNVRGILQIASIKELFSEKAFEYSTERILKEEEIDPKNQVDLDPIVLCRTKHGYLIVTAWGDEANDELVFNQNQN